MTPLLINFDLPAPYIDQLKRKYTEVTFVHCTDRKEAQTHLPNIQILLTFFLCTRKMLDAAPQLKWIQAISAGVDYMDLAEIARREILLTNGRGTSKIQMAEFAIGAMISLARGFHTMVRNQMQKKWDRGLPSGEIHGATVGILGLGAIGGELAKRAAAMGMRVIGVRRTPAPVDHVEKVYSQEEMGALFEQSDYIVNLLPSTPDTEKIIDRSCFDLMKPTASFIHIGRGQTVNEADLVEALQQKKINAMVSDVYETEPLPEQSPLWEMDNVIISPHVCGMSPRYMARAMEIIDHNLDAYLRGQGEMMNVVDLSSGY